MKGRIGKSIRLHNIWYKTSLYNSEIMKKIKDISQFSKSQKAKLRLQVIEFHNKYGTQAYH